MYYVIKEKATGLYLGTDHLAGVEIDSRGMCLGANFPQARAARFYDLKVARDVCKGMCEGTNNQDRYAVMWVGR